MKKAFRNYLGIWAALLVLFNIIAFVSVGRVGQEKYTASFWVGYGLITTAFVGQLFCAKVIFDSKNNEKRFLNIPLITQSYTALVISAVIGSVLMLIPDCPAWITAIVCAVVLGFGAVSIIKAKAAADIVSDTDDKIKAQTFFIKSLTVDAENLLSRAKTDVAKAACHKVCEAARYSDPMSNDALLSIEEKISAQMEVLTVAVAAGNDDEIAAAAEEVTLLIGERNRKCKVLK